MTEEQTKRLEEIKVEYRTLAMQVGQIIYEQDMKKNELYSKMISLNQEANELTKAQDHAQ